MKIAIVTTGDEIMSGNVVDTNSAWIADRCWMLGHEVVWHGGVGDEAKAIGDALKLASKRAEVVFVSGGLGATVDDITVESAAKSFGKKMVFHEDIWRGIRDFFGRIGRECSENNKRQAYIPEGGKPLVNKAGTAPGIQIKLGPAVFFFLPGVPRELYRIFDDSILPWLKEQAEGYTQRLLRCFGIPEAGLDQRLKGIDLGDVRLSFRVTFPEVKIKLVVRCASCVVRKKDPLREAEEKIRARLGDYIYGVDNETLEMVVGNSLKNKGYFLSVAESCTGGLISNLITNVPGSSCWFERGIVCYSNKSKQEILGVDAKVIDKFGAVSEECVREMAEGVRKISGVDLGLAVSGIAGPGGGPSPCQSGFGRAGGPPQKPVGTVHIALAAEGGTQHAHYCQPREREQFKLMVAYLALDMVRGSLRATPHVRRPLGIT